jgi:hypothetical protein
MARHLHAIRLLSGVLRTKSTVLPQDAIRALMWEREPSEAMSPSEVQKEMERAIQFWLGQQSHVRLGITPILFVGNPDNLGHFSFGWHVAHLRDHLIRQLMGIMTSSVEEYLCRECGTPIKVGRRPLLFLCEAHMDVHRRAAKARSERERYQARTKRA